MVQKKKSGGSGASSTHVIKQGLAHPDWFHVTNDGEHVNINVNVTRVPLPSRTLVATRTAVAREGSQVSLVFGQSAPGMRTFAGAMTIMMSAKNIRTAFANPAFNAALNVYAEGQGITPELRLPEPDRYPADRIVTDRATILAMTFADDDTEIRFFRVSPTDLRALGAGETVDLIYPVVQILMHTGELVHLVHTLETVLGDQPLGQSQ